ncbi:Na/Pi symporter [Heyndrickxia acidiproducens]|uniref:Na/Pi symporter n=1 Tax=Heyndrickxia acidiproducens TaxID=1121084 RepID=UPI00036A70FD|nr:Na/Pi symporter [Heyndrickxia acidiproducens]
MLYICWFIGLTITFLFGITRLRTGLFNLSAGAIEVWLKRFTRTPLTGMLFGMLMTALLQSSSAVMVITVGLVSARLLTFTQSIGIILGTNIGTTFTLELLTFKLSNLCLPLLAAGLLLQFFKHQRIKSAGYILFGLALVFAAMRGFEWLAVPISKTTMIQHLFIMLKAHIILAFLLGILLSATIQSSTVTIGMAMGFISSGVFPLETGIAIMLGANIGTCITGLLASFGAGEEPRLTAYTHIWLNAGGALIFFPFIPLLADFCRALSNFPDQQLAHASLLFNLASSLIVLPFAGQFGRLVITVHGKK